MAAEVRMPEFVQGLPRTRKAIRYAARLHAGQLRQVDGAPFIQHPLEVAALLHEVGAPDDVIAAGALHDTLEKTDATADDLAARFGPEIAALVCTVSEDKTITTYAERKAALRDQVARSGTDAALVFAADKLSKVRELRRTEDAPVRRRRLTHYRRCLALLQEKLPGCALVDALEVDVEAIAARARHQQALSRVR
ncbi:MAG: HD domain-containing protein [Solirubrobacteraceae bacterium]